MKNRLTRIAAITIPLLLLSACGDDITEINANVGAVKTSDDLPECTEDIAGQTAFIKETHEFLGCDGKEWQTLSANTVSVGDNVCTSTSLSDGTGFEIFCNGESIGTVKNGRDGEKGADGKDGAPGEKGDKGDDGAPGSNGTNGTNGKDGANGTGCKIQESTALTATIACGSETFTMDFKGYVDVPEECDTTDTNCAVPMEDVELSGVTQKGPFVLGTDITAYELENGRSLKQTGKTFGGKIENQDGSFNIRTVKLKSSFAYLVADGFYRNEVTGRNSNATIKLRALTNLDGRSTANINLVTHLEYDRVQRLVTKENKSVIEAKRAAEKSLFAAFNIDNTGFKGFAEDLNIFKEGDGNAALLAVSAMLQGDRNESELTALLAAFSVDLGSNGEWNDSLRRAQVADWAMKADIEGRLTTIRANVEGWKLSNSKAPAFEGHVTNFWMKEFGVPTCTGDGVGRIFSTKNTYSSYYAANDSAFTEGDSSLVRLICAASGDSYAWRFATDIEKDTYGWPDTADQVRRAGNVNKDVFYVFEEGKWWRAAEGAEVELGACNTGRNGIVANIGKDYYTCAAPRWRAATTLEMDTYNWPAGEDGDVRNGHVNDDYVYVYDGDAWRRGSETDSTYGIGGCTKARAQVGEVAKSINGAYYICRISGWDAAPDFEKDTFGWEKSGVSNGTTRKGQVNENFYYVFDEKINGWRRATEREEFVQQGCTAAQQNLVKGKSDNWFTCDSTLWRDATDFEKDTVGWGVDNHKDADVSIGQVNNCTEGKNCFVYVFEDGTWRKGTLFDSSLGLNGCTNEVAANNAIQKSGEEWYTCEKRAWRKATDIEKDTLGWGAKYPLTTEGDVRNGAVDTNYTYVYNGTNWRRGTALDSLMNQEHLGYHACAETRSWNNYQTAIPGVVQYLGLTKDYYECQYDASAILADTAYHWVVASDFAKDTYFFICSGRYVEANPVDGTEEYWLSAEGKSIYGYVNQGNRYVCDSKVKQSFNSDDFSWRPMTESEKALDTSCTISHIGTTFNKDINDPKDIYKCSASGLWVNVKYWDWRAPSIAWIVDSMVPYEYCMRCGWNQRYNQSGDRYDMLIDSRGSEPQVYFTKEYYMKDWSDWPNSSVDAMNYIHQTWMVQNLNYKTETGSRCFDDLEENCKAGGRLYTKEAAKNACPAGWRLPTRTEWENLIMYAGGGNELTSSIEYIEQYQQSSTTRKAAAKNLLSYNGWSIRGGLEPETTNSSYFSAIPAGYCSSSGCEQGYGNNVEDLRAVFWADGETETAVEFIRGLSISTGIVGAQATNYSPKGAYYSVRCIKD